MRRLLFYALLLFPLSSSAQGGTWTWMKGSTGRNSPGNYGTIGVASATNEPPSRYQACYWTDKNGNFWLFGGVFYSGNQGGNDLWKYDVSTNMWTWMKGPNVITTPMPNGVYGTMGIPSANNFPAGRGYGANCWTDNNGDLWLFGGYGGTAGVRDDLWKYNIATNQWTWMGGNQFGSAAVSYGTMGVASASNHPGAMQEIKSAWVDASNNLWMFGGGNAANNALSALWKYNPATGLWTWMKGSTSVNGNGNYGTMGIETATNEPPARASYTRWKDANDNFYLFAGGNFNAQWMFNDVWKYNYRTNNWTWISGSNLPNDTGSSFPPTHCQFYSNYYPPARIENQTAFAVNSCAKAFWTFGGFNLSGARSRNDLWLFEIDSLKWSWVSGSSGVNDPGSYGTKGLPGATNSPPARGGQCMWIDNNNNLWLFGGLSPNNNGDKYNDLWRFTPDSSCLNLKKLFGGHLTPPDTSLCVGDTVRLRIGSHQSVIYTPGTSAYPNADTSEIAFNPSSTTAYTIIVSGSCQKDDTLHFTIRPNPKAIIKISGLTPNPKCIADTSSIAIDPLWHITVNPTNDVLFQSNGGSSIKFYPKLNTTYVVTASGDCAISDTISARVNIRTSILSHLPPMLDTVICKGDSASYRSPYPMTNTVVKPNRDFIANLDSTVFTFFPPRSTHYTLSGMNAQDICSKSKDSIDFNLVVPTLAADFEIVPTVTTIADPVFRLRNYARQAAWYEWYVNGQFYSRETNPIAGFKDTGTYCFLLVAGNNEGCADSVTKCAKIIDHAIVYLPNAFTPNGDGRNDVLFPHLYGAKLLNFNIYNRYGQRVFIGITDQNGWDGSFNGKACDLGTYFYYLRYAVGDKEFDLKGDITLLR